MTDAQKAIATLSERAELGRVEEVVRVAGGRNNQVFRVVTTRSTLFAKAYFRSEADPRDRLGTEVALLEYAAAERIGCVPRIVAVDRDAGVALFEHLDGRRPRAEEIDEARVDEALRFYALLNRGRDSEAAQKLPRASEASFTLRGYVDAVDDRLARTRAWRAESAVDRDAVAFVQSTLIPAWERTKARLASRATALGFAFDEPLDVRERVVSPADFGFHNTLVGSSGGLVFVDFEYAGWDDPAKTVCDFFRHDIVPVDRVHSARVVTALSSLVADGERFRQRATLLDPLFSVRWCLIFLNEFSPSHGARRHFSEEGVDWEARKRGQLERANEAISSLRERD